MRFAELLQKSRSYRRFDENHRIDRQTLIDLVSLVRFCPSSSNRQSMKFIVACEPDFMEQAEAIVDKLNTMGAKNVTLKEFSVLTENDREENNLILVAGKENQLIIDLNDLYEKLGFFAYFDGKKLVVLDDAGSVVREYTNNCGLIQATQNPWNPVGIGACESVVWTVSGTDNGGIHAALDKLINDPDELHHACACIVENGRIIQIP